MDEIAFIYDEKKNPDGAVLDGVPRRDLTADEFEALRPHYQAAVRATAFYVEAPVLVTPGLSDIDGVGEKTVEKLIELGIGDLVELLDVERDDERSETAEALGVSVERLVAWQAQARLILED